MIPESLETLLRQWMAPGLSVAIAFAVAATAYRAGVIVLRRITRHRPVAALFLKLAEGPGLAVITLIVLQAVLQSAPNDLEGIGAVRHAAALALIAAATWLALRLTAGIADAVALRHPMNVADNLGARRIQTQTRLLTRLLASIVALVGTAFALLTFPGVRSIGASLLASAGIAGLVLGVAAKAVLGNLLAGLHVAMTQPIRIDDVVIIEGEYGRVEEIGSSFVVVAIWDGRRLVVPLQQFMEKPFQNWTRVSGDILGTVFLWVDYGTPLEPLRAELRRICESAPEWDRRVCLIQVTDAGEHAMQLRALVSSADSPRNWDLRCLVRERLLDFIRREYPECLPRARTVELASGEDSGAAGRPEATTRSKAQETEAMV
jgi:small-conductance mechanosensitive channel